MECFCGGSKTGEPREKTTARTNKKLEPHMTPEPRLHCSLHSSLFRFLLARESESKGKVVRTHGARAKRGMGGERVGRKGKACS